MKTLLLSFYLLFSLNAHESMASAFFPSDDHVTPCDKCKHPQTQESDEDSLSISVQQKVTLPWAKPTPSSSIPVPKPNPQYAEINTQRNRFQRQMYCDKVCSNWLGEWLVHTDCKCPKMNEKPPHWGCQDGKTLNHLSGVCECRKTCRLLEVLNEDTCACVSA